MIASRQQLHLVTGKGGVGKSTVAAGLALALAETGQSTLLVELGERSFYSHIWQQTFGFIPSSVSDNLDVSRWQGEDCLKEYLGHLLKVPKIANLFFENRVMKALVHSAPALKELAIVGKLTSGIRGHGPKLGYEHIVLAGYSTGHFKALMNAPVGMAEAVSFGPMGEQSRGITQVLKNKELTRVFIVALPEELPVKETLELDAFMRDHFAQESRVIMNKSQKDLFQTEALKKLKLACDNHHEAGVENISYLDYLINRRADESTYLNDIESVAKEINCLSHQYKPASAELIKAVAETFGRESWLG